ncbi:histidine phosphatase [Mesorhizobium sp. Root157]|uniref:histidine phosphatase family protein n=1 Tax=Mesorhizobium sp. Root157 TaxID=1736477 RepID=UPI0006FF0C9A|nr:histidine phosphatase family protein [Mesorhizobium sp. Root157]KQZ94232.1 histidine phosphatase [Mesorhizobium sp. Root157]
MAARLTLVCCAATQATRKGMFALDEPLEAGAAELAKALGNMLRRPDRAWTSPALRATQTIAALGVEGEPVDALRDQDFGRWAGKRLVEVQQSEPEGLAAWLADPHAAPHGGESIAGVAARIAPVMDELVAMRGHTVAVTHPAVIRAAVVNVLGASPQAFWRIDVEPLGVTEFTSDGKRWALRFG